MNRKGFTLIEMILVITVTAIVAVASSVILQPAMDSWAVSANRLTETDSLSYAMNRMMDEMASIQNNTGVLTASSTRLRFNDGTGSVVDYQLAGSNLMRNSDILARDLDSLTFSYSNVTNAAIVGPVVSPTATDIWRIDVEIVGERAGQTVRLQSGVHPRNFPRS